MGTIIGRFSDTGLPIYKSSQKEIEELNKSLANNQYYANGKNGKLATFKTPKDNCEYQQKELGFNAFGKYDICIIVLGKEISFKTTMEKEDENIQKKVRLEYYNSGKASKLTKEIVEKFYKK